MLPEEIFKQISSLLVTEVNNNNILKDEKTNGKKWNYSICGTPIQIDKTLLMGINWGGGSPSDSYDYKIQEAMPSFDEFTNLYKQGEYKFLKRIEPFMKEIVKIEISTGEFNYSNLCFFRTPSIKDLTDNDFKICSPVFKKMIELIHPKQIISLGTGNIKYLKKYFQDEFDCENPISVPGTSHKIYSGNLLGFTFYNLPHPNARKLSNEIYEKLWKRLFKI